MNSIHSIYIKGTGRRSSDSVDYSKYLTNDTGPGIQSTRSTIYNWKQELVINSADGTKKIYELRYEPIYRSTVSIYINGLLQRQDTDYTLDGKKIIFNENIPSGFNIVATYIAQEVL